MKLESITQRVARITGVVAVAGGMIAAIGVHPASADTFGTPEVLSATALGANAMRVTFRDNSDSEIEFDLKYNRRQDESTLYTGHYVDRVPARAGRGGIITHDVDRLEIGTEYCFRVQAWKRGDGTLVVSGISTPICALTAYPLPAPKPTPKPTPKPVSVTERVADKICLTCEVLEAATPAKVTDRVKDMPCWSCEAPASIPAAPTNLNGVVDDGTRTLLTWTDNAKDETRYELRLNINGRTALHTLTPNATRYALPLTSDMHGTMTYVLTACNDKGCSAAATVTVTQ